MRSLRDFWLSHPALDLAAALVIVGLHLLLVLLLDTGDVLLWAGNARRSSLYQTTAGLAGLIASFGGVLTSRFRSSEGPRMRYILSTEEGTTLRRSLRNALLVPFLVAGTALVCFALDTTRSDRGGVRFVFEVALLLGAASVARSCALFGALDDITDLDAQDSAPLKKAAVAIPDEPAPDPAPVAPQKRPTRRSASARSKVGTPS